MIKIKRVKVLSANVIASFAPHSAREWRLMRPLRRMFYNNSIGLYVLSDEQNEPLCVISLCRYSFLGYGGEVVFLLCKKFHEKIFECMRFIQRCLRRVVKLWSVLCVRVENGYAVGNRFIKHFKFKFVNLISEPDGVDYRLYELRAEWL